MTQKATLSSPLKELELTIKHDENKAFIEGKTVVTFESIVKLILQRKVDPLYKTLGKDPVIVSTELLTSIASAQQDNRPNKVKYTTVTCGFGIIVGLFVSALILLGFNYANVAVTREYLFWFCGGIVAVAIVVLIVARMQRNEQGGKLVDSMEKITGMFS